MSKAELKRKTVGLKCAKRLEDAAESLIDYLRACRDCNDNSADELHGISDSRLILIGNVTEYASFLRNKYSV